MAVSLGKHFDGFVEAQLASGRYRSPDDVLRDGLRLLEQHEAKVKALEDALIEGENSGPPEVFDFDDFIAGKTSPYTR
ncbi:antitoxin [Rhizobium albus]|jgi:antitoxin ParD1/3/4|nr:antitoxin [Rhizobium albus]